MNFVGGGVVYMLCVYMTTPIRPADHLGSMTSTA